jgi:hypothetical protein
MKQLAYFSATLLFYSIASILGFIMLFSIGAYLEYKFGFQIPFVDVIEGKGKVHVPLVGLHINIPFNYSILFMWLGMLYYGIYFYVFKMFLGVFVQENVFESKSAKHLRLFLKLNLIPLIYIVIFIGSIVIKGANFNLQDDYFIVLAHLVIAFLVYLYLDVLNRGKYIKDENDLTI